MSTTVVVTPPELPPLQLPRALAHLTGRLLTPADADTVLAMRRTVLATMPAALRVADPARGQMPEVEQAWATKHLGPRASTLALFDGETLIAFACLLLANAQDPDDPGHLLNLPAHDWPRGAHMAACMVNEDYRGLHLQTKLLNWRRRLAESHHRTLLMGMTACGNTYSRRNMMGCGLGIQWAGEWRPGSWWHILTLDLKPGAWRPDDNRHEWVEASNLTRQRELTADGYVGVAETALYSMERRKESRLQFVHRIPQSFARPPQERLHPPGGPGTARVGGTDFSTECVQ